MLFNEHIYMCRYYFATEYLKSVSSVSEKISTGEYDHQKFSTKCNVICTVDELLYEVNRFLYLLILYYQSFGKMITLCSWHWLYPSKFV